MQRFHRIVMTGPDHARVSALTVAVSDRLPQVARHLGAKIGHATVVPAAEISPSIITMDACAEILDLKTSERRVVRLVYPEAERVPILSPLGAALIGVSERRSVGYSTPEGNQAVLVLKVHFRPEAQGSRDL